MEIRRRRRGDVLVLEMAGKLALGAGDAEAKEAIRSALDQGEEKILLDLAQITMLDSCGVGELVANHTSALRRGAAMKICGLTPRVAEVLRITRLVGVLDLYKDEGEAVRSFAG